MSCFALSRPSSRGSRPPKPPELSPIHRQHQNRCLSPNGKPADPVEATIGALREEVLDLNSKLTRVEQERDYLEKTLNRMQLENLRLARERDRQIDSQSARYEERLVELHSVIAELTKQCEENRIEEDSESLEVSIDDEEEEEAVEKSSCDVSRTSTDINAQAVEAGQQLAGLTSGDFSALLRLSDSTTSLQMKAVQEELADVKERNVQLTYRLQQRDAELGEARRELEEVAQRRVHKPSPVNNEGSKVAERKKIKKLEEEEVVVRGSELNNVESSVVAEHLVKEMQDKSSMQEFSNSFAGSGMTSKLQEFEIELERLSSRIEHLKSQNEVLGLTLEESKSHCDNMTVLIGKYESNSTAQQLVATFNEHIIESLEVLIALLETELSVVLANCKATGLGHLVNVGDTNMPDEELVDRASENRQAAEAVARRLLERTARPDSGLAMPGFEDSSSKNSSSDKSLDHASLSEEVRLRDFISQLRSNRSAIQATVLELESIHSEEMVEIGGHEHKTRTADIEMAVLVQELMALREERSDLRAQVHMFEREKKSLELIVESQLAQEAAMKAHIEQLMDELQQSPGHSHLRDETRSRITELLTTLEKVKRNAELQQQEATQIISDLKRTNSSLSDALEKTKRKYQTRLKRMEQQILQSMLPRSLQPQTSFTVESVVSTESEINSD